MFADFIRVCRDCYSFALNDLGYLSIQKNIDPSIEEHAVEKRYLTSLELLSIATQHAYCADYILQRSSMGMIKNEEEIDALLPITTLMYLAFVLTFKAYCLHYQRPIKEHKNLMELVELNGYLGLSNKDLMLLKTLAKQQAFKKGIDYDLWDNRQQLQVFCAEILSLYERVQKMMPVELQSDFQ